MKAWKTHSKVASENPCWKASLCWEVKISRLEGWSNYKPISKGSDKASKCYLQRRTLLSSFLFILPKSIGWCHPYPGWVFPPHFVDNPYTYPEFSNLPGNSYSWWHTTIIIHTWKSWIFFLLLQIFWIFLFSINDIVIHAFHFFSFNRLILRLIHIFMCISCPFLLQTLLTI